MRHRLAGARPAYGIVVALVLLLSATFASSAGAHRAPDGTGPTRVVLLDGGGDVWRTTLDKRGQEHSARIDFAPDDVTRAVAAHRPHAVVVKVRMADLRRVGRLSVRVALVQPAHRHFAYLMAGAKHRHGHHLLLDAEHEPLACTTMRHWLDYRGDLVKLRVPRGCLGRPSWVRVNLSVGLFFADGGDGEVWYADNPHNHRRFADQCLTQRLHHGG